MPTAMGITSSCSQKLVVASVMAGNRLPYPICLAFVCVCVSVPEAYLVVLMPNTDLVKLLLGYWN